MLIGFIALFLGTALYGYLIYLHIKKKIKPPEHQDESAIFHENMEILGYEQDEIKELLKDYDYESLKKANKKLKKILNKHKLQ